MSEASLPVSGHGQGRGGQLYRDDPNERPPMNPLLAALLIVAVPALAQDCLARIAEEPILTPRSLAEDVRLRRVFSTY
ncbi:MAG: hypothetical protein ACLGIE_05405 [Alphaproteobacteria bacterium]